MNFFVLTRSMSYCTDNMIWTCKQSQSRALGWTDACWPRVGGGKCSVSTYVGVRLEVRGLPERFKESLHPSSLVKVGNVSARKTVCLQTQPNDRRVGEWALGNYGGLTLCWYRDHPAVM